ncbi:hypothetical protein CsatA_030143 [Cannabis sativa]
MNDSPPPLPPNEESISSSNSPSPPLNISPSPPPPNEELISSSDSPSPPLNDSPSPPLNTNNGASSSRSSNDIIRDVEVYGLSVVLVSHRSDQSPPTAEPEINLPEQIFERNHDRCDQCGLQLGNESRVIERCHHRFHLRCFLNLCATRCRSCPLCWWWEISPIYTPCFKMRITLFKTERRIIAIIIVFASVVFKHSFFRLRPHDSPSPPPPPPPPMIDSPSPLPLMNDSSSPPPLMIDSPSPLPSMNDSSSPAPLMNDSPS